MGVRNAALEELKRLQLKSLEAQFKTEIQQGLGCSPFEAEAIMQVVGRTFLPFTDSSSDKMPPGKVSLVLVAADEPAGKPVADCAKRTVCLTVHRGPEDDALIVKHGLDHWRRRRIPDIAQEALSYDVLMTREDFAYRIFYVTPRTISRDLRALRQSDPLLFIPLRSTVHDIGPMLTHRVQVVTLALQGKTTTQICDILRHSPAAVANYIGTFTRCAQLRQENLQIPQIAFLLRRGVGLIRRYVELLAQCRRDKNMAYHLDQLLQVGQAQEKKKLHRRSTHGNRR